MNIPIYFSSVDNILENISNNTIPAIQKLPTINFVDKSNLEPLYNFSTILTSSIDDNHYTFYLRNRDKDQYLKVDLISIPNVDTLSNLEKSMNNYSSHVSEKLSQLKSTLTKLNLTNFNGENDSLIAKVSKEIEDLNAFNLQITTQKQSAKDEILNEIMLLSSKIFEIKKENKTYYNELKKRYSTNLSLESFEIIDDVEFNLEKEKYQIQKLEFEKLFSTIKIQQQEINEKEEAIIKKKESLKQEKRDLKQIIAERESLKAKFEEDREILEKSKELYKQRLTKYNEAIESLTDEEKISRKDELETFKNTKIQVLLEKINNLKEQQQQTFDKIVNLKGVIGKLELKLTEEVKKIEKFYEEKQNIEDKLLELDSQKINLEKLSRIFETDDILYNSLKTLEEDYTKDELKEFDYLFRKIEDKEKKTEISKFQSKYTTLKKQIDIEREKLEEEQEYLDDLNSTYLKNKKVLEDRRIKLQAVLKSESVVNPSSEEQKKKNDEKIRAYQEVSKKLEKQLEEQLKDYTEKDLELTNKINSLDRRENLLDTLNDILKMSKKDVYNDVKKIKKSENKINVEEFKKTLELIENNKKDIAEIMKKINRLDLELGIHYSNVYQYNTGSLVIEQIPRDYLVNVITQVSKKNKTKEAAEALLNKQIEKLKLKYGGSMEYPYELEYLEEEEDIEIEKPDYSYLKEQIKQRNNENKGEMLNNLGL